MRTILQTALLLSGFIGLISPEMAVAADSPITHQISLPTGQSWCDDTMINGLFAQVNTFRIQQGVPALTMSTLGMKDAEMRASQFATYMRTTPPGSPGFDPHQGYDTTAASLGYNIVSENLAFATSDPAYIVGSIWQDSLHLAAMLATEANVMGVSCVYDSGTPYWTYEPGSCTGTGCGTTSTPPPSGTPTLDSEEWAFLTLVNNYRAQNGVGPLQVSVTLEKAALWMSGDMAAKNYFSHTDSLGRSTGARLAAFGYTYSPWGEDLAAGYADAQSTFDQWRTACDPDASGACTYAHRQIMLGSGFTAIGIARAYGSGTSYGWYWTTDFGGYLDQSIPNPTTPPPTPVPTIASFTATPSTVTAGQSATLSWSVTGATSIQIDNGVGSVPAAASKSVTPSQTTTYTLTATNSNGVSTAHATVTLTSLQDTQAPSAPVLTSTTAKNSTEVDLAWTASKDNVGVTGYRIFRNGTALATLSGAALSYADLSVSAGATYSYFVRAFDAAGNLSPSSNSLQVTVPAPPVSGSSCPAPATDAFTGCYYNNTTMSGTPSLVRTDPQINFDWAGNTPDRSVARGSFSVRWQGNFTFAQGAYNFSALTSDGMRLYIDGTLVLDRWTDQPATLYTVSRTLSQGTHQITVEYYEATGSSAAHLTWQSAAPSVQLPTILSFAATPSAITPGNSVALTWNVTGATAIAIDNGVGNVSGTTSKTVTPAQTTTYTLSATNSAGTSTSHVTVTVNPVADTQPPTAPTLTSASAKTSNEVDLTWTASTDNIAVASYQIFRNGSVIASVSGTSLSYADTRVSPSTSYAYALKALDNTGNASVLSNTISATTPAAVSSGNCTTTGTNAFTGCYYNNTTLSGTPALIRTDQQINFDWGGNPPDRSVTRGDFSARWQGTFNFAQGQYTFTTLTSDGMRLYIDGSLVLDHWNDQAATQYTVSKTLSAGTHLIAVDYYEHTGWSTAHVSWQKD